MGALALDSANGAQPTRWRTLLAGVSLARASAPDTIVFARGAELQAIAFDHARLATSGAPRTVLNAVATARGRAHFALSPAGSLVYATAPPDSGEGLVWWSVTGSQEAVEEIRHLRSVTLAPDGARVTGVRPASGRADVWVADVQRGAATRLTHSGINASPVWSATGSSIYFASRTDGVFELWTRDADGTPIQVVVGHPR
jgi:hypothetical protein